MLLWTAVVIWTSLSGAWPPDRVEDGPWSSAKECRAKLLEWESMDAGANKLPGVKADPDVKVNYFCVPTHVEIRARRASGTKPGNVRAAQCGLRRSDATN